MDIAQRAFLVGMTLSLLGGCALQRSNVPGLEPYPSSVKYCDEHVLGAPGSGQINWTGYHTTDPVEKVVSFYLKKYGSGNHEKLDDEDIWRFPPAKPDRVLSVGTPKSAPHSNLCKPVPTTARAVVVISTVTRP